LANGLIISLSSFQKMTKLRCRDYGYDCDYVAEGDDAAKVMEDFGKHTHDEHGIEYSKEALMQFLMRQ